MSREIKFIGWHKPTNKMIDLKAITPLALTADFPGDGLFLPFDDNVVLRQFIGLKDTHGRDIYEGDILKNTVAPGLLSWLVEFKNGCFVIVVIGIDGYLGHRFPVESSTFIDREIIGNKFENPELLNHEA